MFLAVVSDLKRLKRGKPRGGSFLPSLVSSHAELRGARARRVCGTRGPRVAYSGYVSTHYVTDAYRRLLRHTSLALLQEQ